MFSARVGLALVAVVWYIIIWTVGLLGWHTARQRYRNRPRSPLASSPPEQVPGVSIIRPLKGLDANLFENLESTFTQDYPKFEILLSVADEHDQALPVVKDLVARYPGIDASIIIGEEIVGVNPKVNNLIRPYKEAKYDIIWVLDSNIQVVHGTLARAVDALDPPETSFSHAEKNKRRIGLVHHVPLAFTTESLMGAHIEEAFLNTNHAKMYLAINTIAIDSCVIGKSNMYRRSDVDRLTGNLKPVSTSPSPVVTFPTEKHGLPAFARFLAEDNMIASALWHELGLRHDLSCDVSRNAIGDMDLPTYVWRRVRWIRVRKHMVMVATLLEPLTESILVGLLGAWATRSLTGLPMWLFFAIHLSLWLSVDLDVFAKLSGDPVPPSGRWPFIRAWIYRELLALPIWTLAILGNEVSWRGQRYHVLRNGEVKRSDERWGSRNSRQEAGADLQSDVVSHLCRHEERSVLVRQ
ncbi:glycosyltransferase family 21 protein [Ramaria rubella]|nr:glycosyltransferase family 21 protein [Ramaria rubella]